MYAGAIIFIFLGINIWFALFDILLTGATSFNNLINIGGVPSALYALLLCLLYFVVITPLFLGITNWFYSLVGGRVFSVSSVFIFFDRKSFILKSWLVSFLIFIKMLLYSVLLLLIPTGLGFLVQRIPSEGLSSLFMSMRIISIIAVILLYAFMLIMLLIIYSKYFLVNFLICENKNITVSQAFKQSAVLTKKVRHEITSFKLSFLPYLLLALFIVPIFYILPYYLASSALYAKVIISADTLSVIDEDLCDVEESDLSYGL